MGITDKLPLINSSSRVIRLAGFVLYAIVVLVIIVILGAISPQTPETTSSTTDTAMGVQKTDSSATSKVQKTDSSGFSSSDKDLLSSQMTNLAYASGGFQYFNTEIGNDNVVRMWFIPLNDKENLAAIGSVVGLYEGAVDMHPELSNAEIYTEKKGSETGKMYCQRSWVHSTDLISRVLGTLKTYDATSSATNDHEKELAKTTTQTTNTKQPVLDNSSNPIEYDNSSFGQTGQVKYATPEGTVTVNLPAGFYLRLKFGADGVWSIHTAKTASNCVYREEATCPGHALEIMWGKLSTASDDTMQSRIAEAKKEFGNDGFYTKTASGQTAWMVVGNKRSNGRYAAYVTYSDDKSKWMFITIVPMTDRFQQPQSLTPNEFKDFVESINIKLPAVSQRNSETQTVSGDKKESLGSGTTKTAYTTDEWLNKGNALVGQSKYDEAIQAYDKAIEIDPNYVPAWHNKGYVLNLLGKTSESEEAFEKAEKLGYGVSKPETTTTQTKTAYTTNGRGGTSFWSKQQMEELIKAHMAKRDDFKEVQVPLDTPLDEDPAPGFDHEKVAREMEAMRQAKQAAKGL
jgi:tetratricopeptide (TPR) repeat protein